MDTEAQRGYARWMAAQPIAGVAVWAHTGRGPHLSADARREVLETWREAMPDRVADSRRARHRHGHRGPPGQGRCAARLSPAQNDPIGYHQRLSRELPVIAFYLYQAAGGVAYDDATLHGILELPNVIGIKVATLDSVMTFQRIAAVLRQHPSKLLITGEDRFLGLLPPARRACRADRNGCRTSRSPGRSAASPGGGRLAALHPSLRSLRPLCPDHLHRSDGGLHPADAVGGGGGRRPAARGLRRSLGSPAPSR